MDWTWVGQQSSAPAVQSAHVACGFTLRFFPGRRAEIVAMESQLRHTLEAIAQKKRSMAAIQQEIEVQVRSRCRPPSAVLTPPAAAMLRAAAARLAVESPCAWRYAWCSLQAHWFARLPLVRTGGVGADAAALVFRARASSHGRRAAGEQGWPGWCLLWRHGCCCMAAVAPWLLLAWLLPAWLLACTPGLMAWAW